jgi:hypothetical protein
MPPRFTKASKFRKNDVLYVSSDGKRFVYKGGTRTWRNNNPGNLVGGKIARRNGSIGTAGGFAVFPDYASGHRGLIDCLQSTHGKKPLSVMIKAYAPENENDTAKYLEFLRKKTGVRSEKKIRDFSLDEFARLWKAIEKMEGWKEGTIVEQMQVVGVRFRGKKKVIGWYNIESFGWVSKAQGVALAKKGCVDAVIVDGTYLRARPDHDLSNNFDNLA